MLSVMAIGFTYAEAWHMGFRDYQRYTALATAWAIPDSEREQPVRRATRADSHMLL